MAIFSHVLTGRKALRLRGFLMGRNGLGSADKDSLAKVLRRLENKVLCTDESGNHTAIASTEYEPQFTAADVASGVPVEFYGKSILGQNGKPLKMRDYDAKSLSDSLESLGYDDMEKGAIFRLCLDRLRDKATTGAEAANAREIAGWFNLHAAIEKTVRRADKPEPFKDELPDDGEVALSDGDPEL